MVPKIPGDTRLEERTVRLGVIGGKTRNSHGPRKGRVPQTCTTKTSDLTGRSDPSGGSGGRWWVKRGG